MRQTIYRWMAVVYGVVAPPAVLESTPFAGQELIPPPPPRDFSLEAADSSQFRLSQQRGKVVRLRFGYTFCPDVCPTTLVELSQVRACLGDAGKRVQVAWITLDPERDTPERLSIYTKAFDPSFIGLTGSPEQLADICKA